MALIMALFAIQIFNELGALYDKDIECVNRYISVPMITAFRILSLIVLFLSIFLCMIGCYGVRCLGWGLLMSLLSVCKLCCSCLDRVGAHRKVVYYFLVSLNTACMIALLALGMALDDEFDHIKQDKNCTGEELEAIDELDREFFTMNVFGLAGGILFVCVCFGGLNADIGQILQRLSEMRANPNGNMGGNGHWWCDGCCDELCDVCCAQYCNYSCCCRDACDCDCDCTPDCDCDCGD